MQVTKHVPRGLGFRGSAIVLRLLVLAQGIGFAAAAAQTPLGPAVVSVETVVLGPEEVAIDLRSSGDFSTVSASRDERGRVVVLAIGQGIRVPQTERTIRAVPGALYERIDLTLDVGVPPAARLVVQPRGEVEYRVRSEGSLSRLLLVRKGTSVEDETPRAREALPFTPPSNPPSNPATSSGGGEADSAVAVASLNVRAGAGGGYRVVDGLRPGAPVVVLERRLAMAVDGEATSEVWAHVARRVRTAAGDVLTGAPIGWVASRFLSPMRQNEEAATAVLDSGGVRTPGIPSRRVVRSRRALNVRAEPRDDAPIVESLAPGRAVAVGRQVGSWREVLDAGDAVRGWSVDRWLGPTEATEATEETEVARSGALPQELREEPGLRIRSEVEPGESISLAETPPKPEAPARRRIGVEDLGQGVDMAVLRQLREQLEEAENQLEASRPDLERLRTDLERAATALADERSRREDAEGRSDALRREVEKLRTRILWLESNAERELADQVEELVETRTASLRAREAELVDDNDRLRAEIERLKSDEAGRAEIDEEVARQIAGLRQRSSDLQRQFVGLRNERDAAQKALASAESRSLEAQGELLRSESQRRTAEAEAELLRERLREVDERRARVEANWRLATEERDRLVAELQDARDSSPAPRSELMVSKPPVAERPVAEGSGGEPSATDPLPERDLAATPEFGVVGRAAVGEAQVRAFVESWAQAWRAANAETYLSHYAADHRGGAASPAEWRDERRLRLAAPSRISLTLAAVEVRPLDGGRWQVRFRQKYRSELFQDDVDKTLLLEPRDGGAATGLPADLQIVRELATARPAADR